jgi:hypothetical protein
LESVIENNGESLTERSKYTDSLVSGAEIGKAVINFCTRQTDSLEVFLKVLSTCAPIAAVTKGAML